MNHYRSETFSDIT